MVDSISNVFLIYRRAIISVHILKKISRILTLQITNDGERCAVYSLLFNTHFILFYFIFVNPQPSIHEVKSIYWIGSV